MQKERAQEAQRPFWFTIRPASPTLSSGRTVVWPLFTDGINNQLGEATAMSADLWFKSQPGQSFIANVSFSATV